jgi:hypothetical protein
MKFIFFFFIFSFSLLSPFKDTQRRVISDSEYNYAFYTRLKELKSTNSSKFYFWYKSGEIHVSQGASSGNVLHGEYTKSYKSNNLAEKGVIKNGLRDNTWNKWYESGQLYEICNWVRGHRSGSYAQFSEDGKLLIKGEYKHHNKHGMWVNFTKSDTLYYKNGEQVDRPEKFKIKSVVQKTGTFFKNLFSKKEKVDVEENVLENKKPKAKRSSIKKNEKTQKKVKEQRVKNNNKN